MSHEDPVTDDRMALIEALQKADDGNFLRSLAETVLQILMEADVEGLIGAGRYERSGERSTWRNGYRDRSLDTRLGPAQPAHPQAQDGQLLPALPGGAQDGREPYPSGLAALTSGGTGR